MISQRSVNISPQRGFTLIEFMIASMIFAVIGMAAFAMFSQVQQSDEMSLQHSRQLQQLQRALLVLERDFTQLVQRTVRVDEEAPSARWLVAEKSLLESSAMGVTFRRIGWRNPGARLPRAEVQAVGYRLEAGRLERLASLYPDEAVGNEPRVTVLLHDIDDFELRFFYNRQWQNQWTGSGLPQAVDVIITSREFGKVNRIFLLAGDHGGGATGLGLKAATNDKNSTSGSESSGASGTSQQGSDPRQSGSGGGSSAN